MKNATAEMRDGTQHVGVMIEPTDEFVFEQTRTGIRLVVPYALCTHRHRTPEAAFRCKSAKRNLDRMLAPRPIHDGKEV